MNVQKEKEELKSHQFENIYHEDDVPFQDGSNRIVNRLIYFGIGLFVLLIFASFIIKLPREINLPFELKGGNAEYIVQYPEIVYVKRNLVNIGDSVNPRQPLIEIGSKGISESINEIESIKRDISFFNTEQQKVFETSLRIKNLRSEGIEKEIQELNNELQVSNNAKKEELLYLEDIVNIQKHGFERNKALHDSGYIAEREYELSRNNYSDAYQKLTSSMAVYDMKIAELKSSLQVLSNEKTMLAEEIEQLSLLHKTDQIELDNKLLMAQEKLEQLYGRYQIVGRNIYLLSPAAGQITFITSKESEVPSREIILKLEQTKRDYFVYAEANSAQVGQIHAKNKVVLKYHSFPYYYYGTMKSVVESISLSPNEDGNYSVMIRLTDAGRLKDKVSKGMKGNATVIIEEKSISDFIFRSVLKSVSIE